MPAFWVRTSTKSRTFPHVQPLVGKTCFTSQVLDAPPTPHRTPHPSPRTRGCVAPERRAPVPGIRLKRRTEEAGLRANLKVEKPGRQSLSSGKTPGFPGSRGARTGASRGPSPTGDPPLCARGTWESARGPGRAGRGGAVTHAVPRGRGGAGRGGGWEVGGGGRRGPTDPARRGAEPARETHARCQGLPLPPRPPLPPPPASPASSPSPSLLARRVLKLDGWQRTGSARGPSRPASRPRSSPRAARTPRRPGKRVPPKPSAEKSMTAKCLLCTNGCIFFKGGGGGRCRQEGAESASAVAPAGEAAARGSPRRPRRPGGEQGPRRRLGSWIPRGSLAAPPPPPPGRCGRPGERPARPGNPRRGPSRGAGLLRAPGREGRAGGGGREVLRGFPGCWLENRM